MSDQHLFVWALAAQLGESLSSLVQMADTSALSVRRGCSWWEDWSPFP